jgi:hypothetical protein
MESTNSKLEIKPYTKKELAAVYGISPRCFYTWLKKIEHEVGPKRGKYYTLNQVRTIIEKIGLPGTVGE